MAAFVDILSRLFITMLLIFVPTMFVFVNKWPRADHAPAWAIWCFAGMACSLVVLGFLTLLLSIWVW